MALSARQLKALRADIKRESVYNKTREVDLSYQEDGPKGAPPPVTEAVLSKALDAYDRNPDAKLLELAKGVKGLSAPAWAADTEHWLEAAVAIAPIANHFENPAAAVAHTYTELGGKIVESLDAGAPAKSQP